MADKNRFSVSLKDSFDQAQCLDVRERIATLPGVTNVHFMPQGCFGIDLRRIWVDIAPGSIAAEQILKMAEVKAVKKGLNFD
jgi:hypothetical protein